MASTRARFAGKPVALEAILFAAMEIPDFLKYTEDLNGKRQPNKIKKHEAMWRSLHSIHPGLTFTQKFMTDAFKLAAGRAGRDKWNRALAGSELDSWATWISKKFRAMARHIAQGLSADTAWVKTLLGIAGEDDVEAEEGGEEEQAEGDEEEIEEDDAEDEPVVKPTPKKAKPEPKKLEPKPKKVAAKAKAAAPKAARSKKAKLEAPAAPAAEGEQWVIAYDAELNKAYRTKLGSSDKEWGFMEAVEGEMFPKVTFACGQTASVNAIATEIWQQRIEGEKSAVLFKGEKGGDEVLVVRKVDHCLLVVLYLGKAGFPRKFLCMMSVKAFGPESEVCMVKNGSHPLGICLGLWGCARPGGRQGWGMGTATRFPHAWARSRVMGVPGSLCVSPRAPPSVHLHPPQPGRS